MTSATDHNPLSSNNIAAALALPYGLGASALRLPHRPPASADPLCTGTVAAFSAEVDTVPSSSGLLDPITRLADDTPACREMEWGDGSAPPLYLPPPDRIDDVLAAEVDTRLTTWARGLGLGDDDAEQLRSIGYGRLVMLTHSECDDPDCLLVAAQMNTAWWMADDLFADDTARGAISAELGPRLSLVMAVLDPLPSLGEFSARLDEALSGHLVFRAFDSALAHLRRHATPGQVQRACYATAAMFVSWNAYAAWRESGRTLPAWEYLAARQHDSFYTSMTLIDPVAGYLLPDELFYRTAVRHAAFRAGTAAVLVNDLLSVAKDAADENPVCNVVLQVAADRDCSLREATEIVVDLHNRVVRDFEAARRAMLAVPVPELRRYLRGLRSWMAGSFEWHNTNPRYR
ncbi:terpene synthase [Nocardia sp. CDC159]|uniref:Terpene synthase n=1 Tax=Nocardia pulmonis TaxID=2951408 RepID=A0A9X2EA13_9NOCA|nr:MULTISPECIES: family 2 encapsulin nanocompartment cargo protein terpene cyclase [Nocardia]MCM6777074.1 terpene synthase [Nocardia pulmonis]MCM6789959.1 terpene synthase [Nocardia sp. CDC159]